MVYVLRVCVGCAFSVLVLWCIVVCVGLSRVVFVVCGVLCGVCGAAWHAEKTRVVVTVQKKKRNL